MLEANLDVVTDAVADVDDVAALEVEIVALD
jgi:hypothetical protein